MPFLKFIQYHNAVPIALGVLFLGAGATFAATDPQALYSANQTVVSVDNTYIANKDISNYSPKVEIASVTEDADNYYVAYNLTTIDVQNSVWQDVTKAETMTVSKADLGQYRDLGVYVTEQLKQIVDREMQRLATTQEIERKNVTQKTVATAYGGLIGKFLDSTTEELPGYVPVVTPPPPSPQVAAADATQGDTTTTDTQTSAPQATQGGPGPVLQVLGNNPVQIPLKSSYIDLGASIVSPLNSNLGIHVFVKGVEVSDVNIDTSAVADWTITYKATDQDGNVGTAERIVRVFDPAVPAQASSTPEQATSTPGTPDTSATSSNSTSTPQ